MAHLSPAALLATLPPASPLVTQYDAETGDRVELSAATLGNWMAKTCNLLLALGRPPAATVLVGAHWQAAAIALGCWAAGVPVLTSGPSGVVFAEPARFDEALDLGADETYGVSLSPLGMPLRSTPAGIEDYVTEVRAYGDVCAPAPPWTGPALDTASFADLAGTPQNGARLLVDGTLALADWFVRPLLAGASIVLVRNADPAALDRIATTENATLPR